MRLRVEWNCPGTGLAVDKDQRVGVDFRPAQMEDFALAASGEQEQADDVGLLPGVRPFPGIFIKNLMQAPEFVPGKEAGELATAVGLDAINLPERVRSPSRGSLVRQHQGASTVVGWRWRRRPVRPSAVSVA